MLRMLALTCGLALVASTGAGSVAAATDEWQPPRFEVGAFAGVMDFDTARGLNGEVYGGRFGVNLSSRLGFEAVLGRSLASSPSTGATATMWISHADLMLHFSDGPLMPYVSGGFGNLSASTTGQSLDQFNFDVGGGIKMWVSDHLAVRGDMHGYFGSSAGELGDDRRYTDVMATVGLVVGAGETRRRASDIDQDGVADIDDRCPDTPMGVGVDAFGCPADTDGDGIADFKDECTGTPRHAWVDDQGCPTDEDADGVVDGLDRCLDTPANARVDARGCPIDSDGDGVYDGIDRCQQTSPSVQVDEWGCEVAQKPATIERKIVLHSINFSSGQADILPSSYPALDDVATSLRDNPQVRMEVRGYADSMGPESYNLKLTQDRAAAVRNYLIEQGVEPSRLRARGYGESEPIASNDTSEGRAMNRRVEFHRID